MARIRTIKPEFWTSAQILECSRNARLLFIGLWNFADDAGRHPDSAKQAKAEVFPADDLTLAEVQALLDELAERGLIHRYTADGVGYFVITGWKHQRIDKPQPPKYPDPFQEDSKNIPGTLPPEGIGEDTKGGDRRGTRKHPIPDDFSLDDGLREYATVRWLDPDKEFEKFRTHHKSNGTKFSDWRAAYQKWCVKAVEFREKDRPRGELGALS